MSRKLLLVFAFVLLVIGGTWNLGTHPYTPHRQQSSTHIGKSHSRVVERKNSRNFSNTLKDELTLYRFSYPHLLNLTVMTTTTTSSPTSIPFPPATTTPTSTVPVGPSSAPTPTTIPVAVASPPPAGLTPSASTNDIIPPEWMPTAICEEGGRNDPYAGYFGILEWSGAPGWHGQPFMGYPTAGSAPASVQLQWEAAVGQTTPPDAPGQCHGY